MSVTLLRSLNMSALIKNTMYTSFTFGQKYKHKHGINVNLKHLRKGKLNIRNHVGRRYFNLKLSAVSANFKIEREALLNSS